MNLDKRLLVLSAVILCVSCSRFLDQEWNAWKATHEKTYVSPYQETFRRQAWEATWHKVQEHNRKYEQRLTKYRMVMNKFADLTEEERNSKNCLSGNGKTFMQSKTPVRSHVEDYDIPKSVDWRDEKCVTQVKDQGFCGSCWAFAAVGVIESHYCIQTKELIEMSEQQLVDCDEVDKACCGGLPPNAFEYAVHHGVMRAKDYEYSMRQNKCQYKAEDAVKLNVSKYYILQEEDNMASSVAKDGPIAVGIDASSDLQLYGGGIFSGECTTEANHAVIIVGYGTEHDDEKNEDTDYWIVRNSWGKDWGEHGYVKMQRNVNLCGIMSMPSSVDLL